MQKAQSIKQKAIKQKAQSLKLKAKTGVSLSLSKGGARGLPAMHRRAQHDTQHKSAVGNLPKTGAAGLAYHAFLRSFVLPVFCTSVLPFAFRLSPFTFVTAFCFLLSAFCFQSCRFNPNLQGKGEVYLQGTWQQDSTKLLQQLVTDARYHIRFDCDSFFMQIKNRSKTNYGNDTCHKSGQWAEYIKGAYSQKNDTLFFKGQFCNANFTLKTDAGCFRIGPYQELFKVGKETDSLIQLFGTSTVVPLNLYRIRKTTCTQKSL